MEPAAAAKTKKIIPAPSPDPEASAAVPVVAILRKLEPAAVATPRAERRKGSAPPERGRALKEAAGAKQADGDPVTLPACLFLPGFCRTQS